MPINSPKRTPVSEREGIKISEKTRRDEYFRPVKKLTSVRIDADVLDWLKSKGEGHITRINEILRREMVADRRR